MEIVTKTEKQTIALGKKFTAELVGGEVVLLIGDFGSGKTTFVKGVAEGLGIPKVITSPTFVIMKMYDVKARGIKKLVHLDTYRGLSFDDFENIGALELFGRPDVVSLIEWGSDLEDYLKREKIDYRKIMIMNVSEKERKFIIN